MKPVVVDPGTLFVINAKSVPVRCWKCIEEQARWFVGRPPNIQPMCSHCFLYKTPWGEQHSGEISALVQETEKEMGRIISDDGRVRLQEADRIVMAIRFASALKPALRKIQK